MALGSSANQLDRVLSKADDKHIPPRHFGRHTVRFTYRDHTFTRRHDTNDRFQISSRCQPLLFVAVDVIYRCSGRIAFYQMYQPKSTGRACWRDDGGTIRLPGACRARLAWTALAETYVHPQVVMKQLQYCGILETVKVRQSGYMVRQKLHVYMHVFTYCRP